jgi:hypothetical protein
MSIERFLVAGFHLMEAYERKTQKLEVASILRRDSGLPFNGKPWESYNRCRPPTVAVQHVLNSHHGSLRGVFQV